MNPDTHAAAGSSVSDYLAHDHERLDARLADSCQLFGRGCTLDAAVAFEEFARGLQRHIGLEEELLFPVFDARVGMAGPTAVMRQEHRRIEALVAAARAALADADVRAFLDAADEIAAALQAHNVKEERILYPRTDAALGHDERALLVARMVNR
jgi:regulator of cell morphogenesis and NO signaling